MREWRTYKYVFLLLAMVLCAPTALAETQVAIVYGDGNYFPVTLVNADGTEFEVLGNDLFPLQEGNSLPNARAAEITVTGVLKGIKIDPETIQYSGLNNEGFGAFHYKVVNKRPGFNFRNQLNKNHQLPTGDQDFWGEPNLLTREYGVIYSRLGTTIAGQDDPNAAYARNFYERDFYNYGALSENTHVVITLLDRGKNASAENDIANILGQPNFICFTNTGCLSDAEVSTQQACESIGGEYVSNPSAANRASCEDALCEIDGVCSETPKYLCEQAGGEIDGDACQDDLPECTPTRTTNCMCENVEVPSGQYCCEGTISSEACQAPSTPTQTPPGLLPLPPGICGDGVLQEREPCDYQLWVDESDYGACQSVNGQYCTQACTCGIQPNQYSSDTCNPINEECRVDITCSADAEPEIILHDIRSVVGATTAEITWQIGTCEEEIQSQLIRYYRNDNPTGYVTVDVEERVFSWQGLPQEADLEIQVQVRINDELFSSEKKPFYTGDRNCLSERREFCSSRTVLAQCDAKNVETTTSCASNEVCAPTTKPSPTGTIDSAACQPRIDCEACNAGYNSFGEATDNRRIDAIINDVETSVFCRDLQAYSVGEQVVSYCYLDFDQGALMSYMSCSDVQECTDYKNPTSCEANTCLLPGARACAWNNQAGVCTSTDPARVTCNVQGVDENSCGSINDACQYVDGECINTERDAMCDVFTTQNTCTGGSDFQIDLETHEVLSESINELGLTKCRWLQSGICRKDSNMDARADPHPRDFTNPVTTINVNNPYPPMPTIAYSVYDENPVTTYAYMNASSCENVPLVAKQKTAIVFEQEGLIKLLDANETGTYCVTYYSEDDARNLEQVRQVEIIVETQNPNITGEQLSIQPFEGYGFANVLYEVNLSIEATCSFDLVGSEAPKQENLHSDKFQIAYNGLPQAQYRLDVSCVAPRGRLDWSRQVAVNFDTRIINPQPSFNAHKAIDVEHISIDVNDTNALCQYRPVTGGEWSNFTQKQNLTESTYTRYLAELPSNESRFYAYDVSCFMSEGFFVQNNKAHRIVYAIDDQPPIITITRTSEQEPTPLEGVVEVPDAGAQITVTCKDQVIPGLADEYVANHASQGEIIRLADGEVRVTRINEPGQTSVEVTLRPDDAFQITCVDALGNAAEPINLFAGREQIAGPERPTFRVVS